MRGIGLILLASLSVAAKSPSYFEEIRKSPESIWRTAGTGKTAAFVSKDGFAAFNGKSTRHFRWSKEMGLLRIRAEDSAALPVYALSGQESIQLQTATRLRADSPDSGVSVLYYFGSRGFEFDIVIEPGVSASYLELEFLDGEFSLGSDGGLLADGEVFLMRPAARQGAGDKGIVPRIRYELLDSRHVRLVVEGRSSADTLTIDPVVVYATYFGGSDDDGVRFLREMADGTVLFAGMSRSIDLPEGYLLQGLTEVSYLRGGRNCYIARLSPATKNLVYVSYFGGGQTTVCSSFDVDASERVLIAGFSDSYTLPTSGAEMTVPVGSLEGFLARVSADGKQVQYATYLRLACPSTPELAIRHGAADTAFLVSGCSYAGSLSPRHLQPHPGFVNIFRYDIATRRIADLVTFGPDPEQRDSTFTGFEIGPSGIIHLFGQTRSTQLPLRNPYQSAPPTNFREASFVAGVTTDLRSLVYSTYVGGQGTPTSVLSVTPGKETIWIAGQAWIGSIPGIAEAQPGNTERLNAPFILELPETGGAALHSLFANDSKMTDAAGSGVVLNSGQFCLAGSGNGGYLEPGTAATRFSNDALMVGCVLRGQPGWSTLNAFLGGGLDASHLIATSKDGGVWSASVQRANWSDVIPYNLKPAALLPFPGGEGGDVLLQRIVFGTPRPELLHPPFIELRALRSNTPGGIFLDGKGFTRGMVLEVDGHRMPLVLNSSTTAEFQYRQPAMRLPAGIYNGRLVIPVSPEIASEPFRVIVRNEPPTYWPVGPTRDRRIFTVAEPFYDGTEVTLSGVVLPKLLDNGRLTVEVPENMATPGTGEFTVRNPSPGGGIQKQTVQFNAASSVLTNASTFPSISIPLELPQIDQTRKLAYGYGNGQGTWIVKCSDLRSGRLLRSAILPKDGAVALIDAALSTDGTHFYVIDNLLRVTRYETAGLTANLRFSIVPDSPPQRPYERRVSIRAMEDSPETLLVGLPSGRMAIYDRDLPRAYRSSDFPSAYFSKMNPVLVTPTAVFAVDQGDIRGPVPCLVRYPIDGLGFGLPEDNCSPGGTWEKYPEMRRYGDRLILEGRYSATRILQSAGGNTLLRSRSLVLPTDNLEIRTEIIVPFDGYGLRLYKLDTGEPVGIYPPGSPLRSVEPLALLEGEILVFADYGLGDGTVVWVEPNLKSVANWNP